MTRLLTNVAIWITAFFAFAFVYSVCAVRMDGATVDTKTLIFTPKNSTNLIAENLEIISKADATKVKTIRENAKVLLKQTPLNDHALLHLAVADLMENGTNTNGEILLEAKSRNPRNRGTLRMLMYYHLNKGDVTNTINELSLLQRLDDRNSEEYDNIMRSINALPGGQEKITALLSTAPSWGYGYLQSTINESNAQTIQSFGHSIIEFSTKTEDRKSALLLMQSYLAKLIEFGFIEEAYAEWAKAFSVGPDYFENGNIAFNPKLEDLRATIPFNWQHARNNHVTVSLERNSGMFLSYDGKKPQIGLRQFLPLNAQSRNGLKLSVEADLHASSKQGSFEWRAYCYKEPQILFKAKIGKTSTLSESLATFAVPEDCAFLDLQLWGIPGIYPSRVSLTLKEVQLTPLSSSYEN
ncbi:hypothetical protein DES40_1864 [Litorimonas taeanensis]|uniref:Uncharacterized protein n=1 Tax=Litorimonas taeanensis TaxID=568099 RepID=A0A420WDL7_9PROT|nr:hypothetical protein [Litorimonas taeanensis]RKQ69083.1 hypothetical protein DES40_1864 [Litorimonas taeanensis]